MRAALDNETALTKIGKTWSKSSHSNIIDVTQERHSVTSALMQGSLISRSAVSIAIVS